ncbi:ankyrin repeat domain-containing protein EMB506, chloroplastic isoform X1 [Cucurbita pepo subsp. pepo]|uniref:ankyrin repeat domain-containing protein EMB506, chloroplastic isoform X1 n=2 Tax=Cucurbita pepo subsp. pepo TaxID=3664 RepID=UPI000C9D59D5|nr:ankyrin repeat domain-containing protein EMB506, chloroplastic isoform X1 [Cucurbita pepo subsp. pepo]
MSWALSTFVPSEVSPVYVVATASGPLLGCTTSCLEVVGPRRTRLQLSLSMKWSSMRTFATEFNRVSHLPSRQETWEDPDDGSGSDFDEEDDEEEEVDEYDLNFESDWEGEGDVQAVSTTDQPAANKYEEDLRKEIEQLLEPEERAILQQNATLNVDKLSTPKWNPLHTFALSSQIIPMDRLLESGFDIDSVDEDGFSALHKAIIGRKDAVIGHLLRKGASPHIKDKNGATPLHYAVQVGAKQIVKLLIKYNVDVNVADSDGWTPLHIAIQGRNRDITKILLVNGADRNRRNKDGKTPLDLSLCYGKNFKSYDLSKLLKVVPVRGAF